MKNCVIMEELKKSMGFYKATGLYGFYLDNFYKPDFDFIDYLRLIDCLFVENENDYIEMTPKELTWKDDLALMDTIQYFLY